jgi:hypothetical protein
VIDVQAVLGSSIRDADGTLGRVAGASRGWVRLNWFDTGQIAPRKEVLRRSDLRLDTVQILTLNTGWIPLGQLVGAKNIAEKSKHSPFQHKNPLGPGPKGKKIFRKGKWVCKAQGPNAQICRNVKGNFTRVFRTDPEKKAAYRALWRAWRRGED